MGPLADLHHFCDTEISSAMISELRSDIAGEMGAVFIYRGILAFTRDPQVREFAHVHLAAERKHLDFFKNWLPDCHHSKPINLWKVSGYALGAIGALMGPDKVYAIIQAVEEFVVEHYQKQIEYLQS